MRSVFRPATPVLFALCLVSLLALVQCSSNSSPSDPDGTGIPADRFDILVSTDEFVDFRGYHISLTYPTSLVEFLRAQSAGVAASFFLNSVTDGGGHVVVEGSGNTVSGPGGLVRLTFRRVSSTTPAESQFILTACLIAPEGQALRPSLSCTRTVVTITPDGRPELACQAPVSIGVGEVADFKAFATLDGVAVEDGTRVNFAIEPENMGTISNDVGLTVDGLAGTEFSSQLQGASLTLSAWTADNLASCFSVVSVTGPPCPDVDGDGFSDEACGGSDCDDTDPAINPGATEICDDGIDNNCNGLVDGADPACPACPDADGDGWTDSSCGGGDCDDTDPAVNPGADEICDDGIDNDCDGLIDAADPDCGPCDDQDNDGWTDEACGGSDCDDTDPAVNPDADEICDDGLDNDCDGLIDTADPDCGPCDDQDSDGWLDDACGGSDCDDTDAAVNPDATENCADGIDNDCNGLIDSADPACMSCDRDNDGYIDVNCAGNDCDDLDPAINPAASEVCNDVKDNDCNGLIDCQETACAAQVCAGDGFSCTTDVCVSGTCVSTPDDSLCPQDGLWCNGPEICVPSDPNADASGCLFAGTPCGGNGEGCDEANDRCVEIECADFQDNDGDTLVDCDDPDCDGISCSDGVACTVGTCQGGVCISTPEDALCQDGLWCNGWEICDPSAPGVGPDGCIDGTDPCTPPQERCDEDLDMCIGCDQDGDMYFDENCGGLDCDDSDDQINPGAVEICDDGIDNDCNGLIDAADPACP